MSAAPSDPQLARYSFRRKLEEIAAAKGRATELISLYVSPGKQISDVMAYLRNEYAQSSNIKSRTTRKNVMWAIESLMGRVRGFKEPPTNGVAFFVGSKAVGADKSEPVTFIVEPPEPLNTYLYRCDSTFFLDPLLSMVHEPEDLGPHRDGPGGGHDRFPSGGRASTCSATNNRWCRRNTGGGASPRTGSNG